MGAGTLQKGALGQQLAASGQARRAEALSRKKKGRGPVGKGRARAVIEDRMDQNDKEGKQKQGKGGRPGRPIDGRPPVSRPIEGGDQPFPGKPPWMDEKPFPPKEGRPFEPPMDGRPPSKPIRGDDQFGPGGPIATLPYFPGKPPGGGRPPNMPEIPSPRPPVEKQPWGREDDPNYGRKKDAWHQRRKEMEMKRKEDMWRRAKERRGGTDLGPGRGDRLPEDPYFSQDRFDALRQQGGQNLERPGAAATTLQDFLAQMSNLRGGGIK